MVDVALVALIVVGLGGVVLGRVLPALGHQVFVVAGPSMEPAIPVGAAVVLETVPAEALRAGDIVTLKSGPARAVFTHRIVRLAPRDDGLWIETKGDANPEPDPSITPAASVVGRVAATLPFVGYALTVLSAPAGVVFVLSTGALLIVLGWSLDGLASDRRRRQVQVADAAPIIVSAPPPSRTRPSSRASSRPGVPPPSRRPANGRSSARSRA